MMPSLQQQLQAGDPPIPQYSPMQLATPASTQTNQPMARQLQPPEEPQRPHPMPRDSSEDWLAVFSDYAVHITKIATAVLTVLPLLSSIVLLLSKEITPSMLSYSLIGDREKYVHPCVIRNVFHCYYKGCLLVTSCVVVCLSVM